MSWIDWDWGFHSCITEVFFLWVFSINSFYGLACSLDWSWKLFKYFLTQVKTPVDGLKEWLDAVSTARIPCAIVSSLDRKHMLEALDRMSLKKYFQVDIDYSNIFLHSKLEVRVTSFCSQIVQMSKYITCHGFLYSNGHSSVFSNRSISIMNNFSANPYFSCWWQFADTLTISKKKRLSKLVDCEFYFMFLIIFAGNCNRGRRYGINGS